MIEFQGHSHSRGLELGHQKCPVIIESHRLILLKHAIASEPPLKFALLVVDGLSLDQSLLATLTDCQGRWPGKTTATLSTQAAGADLAMAEAMNATAASVAPIAYPVELGKIMDRSAAAGAEVRSAFGNLLQRTSAIIRNPLRFDGKRTPGRIADEVASDDAPHAACPWRRQR